MQAIRAATQPILQQYQGCTDELRYSKYVVYEEGLYDGWWHNGRVRSS